MKKYVKPELFYERFELSQHIADCDWELTNSTKDTCSAEADETLSGMENLFVSVANGCVYIPAGYEGSNYEGLVCYHDGGEGANVFAS